MPYIQTSLQTSSPFEVHTHTYARMLLLCLAPVFGPLLPSHTVFLLLPLAHRICSGMQEMCDRTTWVASSCMQGTQVTCIESAECVYIRDDLVIISYVSLYYIFFSQIDDVFFGMPRSAYAF